MLAVTTIMPRTVNSAVTSGVIASTAIFWMASASYWMR